MPSSGPRVSPRARRASDASASVRACGFGDEQADAAAREILADAYPGRTVVTVDARPLFDRGGGIHCITQQQPSL
jgi:agmatine deiminase